METNELRKRLLEAGSALQVLALVGAGAAVTGLASAPAVAQDYTSGAIVGQVTDNNGAPVAGATVTALPAVVHLYFEEPPVSGYTAAVVVDPAGRSLNSGALSPDVRLVNMAATWRDLNMSIRRVTMDFTSE